MAGGGSNLWVITVNGKPIGEAESVALMFMDGAAQFCKHVWQPLDRSMPTQYLCIRCNVQIGAQELAELLKNSEPKKAYSGFDADMFTFERETGEKVQVPAWVVRMIEDDVAKRLALEVNKQSEFYVKMMNDLRLQNAELLAWVKAIRTAVKMELGPATMKFGITDTDYTLELPERFKEQNVPGITDVAPRKVRNE